MTDKEKTIAYIDKLLEKYPKNYYLLTVAEFIDSLQEEPVSDELEKAAKKYGTKKHPMTTIGSNESAYDFKSGAQWQKEQIMKDALECVVKLGAGGYHYIERCVGFYDYDKDIPHAKEGDKVKVIVIKEE